MKSYLFSYEKQEEKLILLMWPSVTVVERLGIAIVSYTTLIAQIHNIAAENEDEEDIIM